MLKEKKERKQEFIDPFSFIRNLLGEDRNIPEKAVTSLNLSG